MITYTATNTLTGETVTLTYDGVRSYLPHKWGVPRAAIPGPDELEGETGYCGEGFRIVCDHVIEDVGTGYIVGRRDGSGWWAVCVSGGYTITATKTREQARERALAITGKDTSRFATRSYHAACRENGYPTRNANSAPGTLADANRILRK